jgi:hypothetical protein
MTPAQNTLVAPPSLGVSFVVAKQLLSITVTWELSDA